MEKKVGKQEPPQTLADTNTSLRGKSALLELDFKQRQTETKLCWLWACQCCGHYRLPLLHSKQFFNVSLLN